MSATQMTVDGVLDDGTVVCVGPRCGLVHEAATALVRELRADRAGVESDLRAKRGQIRRLQGEQEKAVRESPHYQDALEILELWRNLCEPKARELNGNRAGLVVARLKKRSRQELEQAVIGYARFPYVVDRRRSMVGRPSERHVRAELIFGDDDHVVQGIALAERGDDVAQIPRSVLARLSWRAVRAANLRLIQEWLRREYGPGEDDGFDNLVWPCPVCRQGIAPLKIDTDPNGPRIARCYECGADEDKLIAVIA